MKVDRNYYQSLKDEQLFEFVQNDDQAAFAELYKRYWTFLLDMAYKSLQCRDKAEDIVQEIFVSLYQRRKAIQLEVSLRAYLYNALKFKAFNEIRSKLVRQSYQKSTFFSSSCKIDFAPPCETKELKTAIENSVHQLPEKCRQTFLLSREEHLSYKDISGELNISVSTVEKHIIKALKCIKGNLNLYL